MTPELARVERAKKLSIKSIGNGAYLVSGPEGHRHIVKDGRCDCEDHRYRGGECKHLKRVALEKGGTAGTPLQIVPPERENGWEPKTEEELAEIFDYDLDLPPNGDVRGPDESFPVVRVLEGKAPDPPNLLVDDLLMDADINMWSGHGGSGKSVLAHLTAISVALARPVFGTLAVKRSGRVLLVLPEDGQSNARMMLDAMIAGLELTDDERALCADRLIMVPDDARVSLINDTARLGETARVHKAVLVIGDPKRNLLGGAAENDNDVAGACLDSIRRDVCRVAGAAVLLTDHLRKPNNSDTVSHYDARGASAWQDGSRLTFRIEKKDRHITMIGGKANRVQSSIRHELELTIDADPENKANWKRCILTDSNAGATSEALTPGKGRALNSNEQAALNCLDDAHEPGKRLAWSTWRDDSGLNPHTFKSVKKRLLDANLAVAVSTGRKNRTGGAEYAFQITSEGRIALKSGWTFERSRGEHDARGEQGE